MKIRPTLKVGDLCRFHKSVQKRRSSHKGRINANPLMVVTKVGIRTHDGRTPIRVRYLSKSVEGTDEQYISHKFVVDRRSLWKCSGASNKQTNSVQEALNIIGRRK